MTDLNVKEAEATLVLTDYWSEGGVGHRSYRGVWRTTDDAEADTNELHDRLCEEAGVQDGDEFEVTIKKTGRRPFGDRRVRYVRPHTYERETEEEAAVRKAGLLPKEGS